MDSYGQTADLGRARVYEGERRLAQLRRRGGPVTVYGSTWDVERETRFETIESIQAVCDRITRWLGGAPVQVRERRGHARATYLDGVIAIPTRRTSDGWALTLLTVLHEVAHHRSAGDGHGPRFRAALLDLLRLCDQGVSAGLLRLFWAEGGLLTPGPALDGAAS